MTEPETSAAETEVGVRSSDERVARRAGLAVVALGLLWLVAKLWAAYQQIHQDAGDTVAVATATLAVPAVVQAAAVAGLAGGIGLRLLTPIRRYVAAPLGGLVVGLAALGAILATYGSVPSIGGVAAAVALAGLLGGAAAGIGRHTVVATAGLAAALGAFVVDTILNSGTVLGHMMSWFGAGHDAIVACGQTNIDGVAACARIVDANAWVSHIDSVVAGVVAGLVAFWYLRRRDCGVKFPGYLIAGATTGLVLLASEVLARIGGAALAHTARQISDADATAVNLLASSRMIHALLVFFVGAFVALVAFGRTLPPKTVPPARPARDTTPAGKAPGQRGA